MPAGAYTRIPAWTGGAAWFDTLLDALATPAGELARATAHVAAGTLLRVARAEWLAADALTGRGVTTAHDTLATQLGMAKITVRRARTLLETLGFATTVETGRYLTTSERTAAARAHGGTQLRAASVRALTLPGGRMPTPAVPVPVENEHLPLPQRGTPFPSALNTPPTRAHAHAKAAPRPQHRPRRAPSRRREPVRVRPRGLELQQLAASLARRLPWIDTGSHIGVICDALTRAGVEAHAWTAAGLLDAIEAHCRQHSLTVLNPTQQRDPLGYLIWLIGQALTLDPTGDRSRRAAHKAAQLERQQRRDAADAAERDQTPILTRAEITALRAASDAQIAAMNQAAGPRIQPARLARARGLPGRQTRR